jgi:hypothetical protein
MPPVVAPATQRVAESFALRFDSPDTSTTGLGSRAAGVTFPRDVIRHQIGSELFARKALRVGWVPSDPGPNSAPTVVARVVADLYCERKRIVAGGS